MFAIFQKHM